VAGGVAGGYASAVLYSISIQHLSLSTMYERHTFDHPSPRT
jgi:hypothetical protein